MASYEEAFPSDHGSWPERIYEIEEAEEITARFLHGMVEDKWGGDWKQESIPGFVFHYPKVGIYDGRMLEVGLLAETVRDLVDNGEETLSPSGPPTSLISLEVSEPDPALQETFIEQAMKISPEEFQAWLKNSGVLNGDEIDVDCLLTPGKLLAKRVIAYRLPSNEGYDIERFGVLQAGHNSSTWAVEIDDEIPEDEENENYWGEFDMLFHQRDLDNFIAAAHILSAPPDIIAYLQTTRDTPPPESF